MSALENFTVGPNVVAADLVRRLDRDGLVVFAGTSATVILDIFRDIVDIVPHRHGSAVDMVTALVPRDDATGVAGLAGFTHDFMPPHTDGSALVTPPELICLVCVEAAAIGGFALLVDGAAVVADLQANVPHVVDALIRPNSVHFGDAPNRSAILSLNAAGTRATMRYREDGLADYDDIAAEYEMLRMYITQHTQQLAMHVGDGYILQNGRWLHGRTEFVGRREMHRLLGYVRASSDPHSTIQTGFEMHVSPVEIEVVA